MSEFLHLLPPPDALAVLRKHLSVSFQSEWTAAQEAIGRVTRHAVHATGPLPAFARSTVDGFAVRAADTHGATESLPAYLQLVGEVQMGAAADIRLQAGQCALIHTGGMMPEQADAVVMVEHTQRFSDGEIEVMHATAVGENVLQVGEDVQPGDQVLPAGVRLRPAELGGLMALGITQVETVRRPRVALLSSGDEVVPPDQAPGPGQVRDINTYTLQALVRERGGIPVTYGIIPDRQQDFRRTARRALDENDMVVFTAGSSVSVRDLTAATIDELGSPGTLVHGVSVRPGKPTILAVCNGKPVIGLPGNPVSALVIAEIFVVPVLETLSGLQASRPRPSVPARLTINLASQSGREDWVGVRLVSAVDGYLAEPIFGKSNLIFTLARADGLLRIPADATGIAAGEWVEVVLF